MLINCRFSGIINISENERRISVKSTNDYSNPPPPEIDVPDGEHGEEQLIDRTASESVRDFSSITTANGKYIIHCLTIVGQIEGHYSLPAQSKSTKYEHIIPQIVAVEESRDIDGMLILLNTVGGDVEAGLAIAEMIAGMHKPSVSLVLGGGHSIGVPLAVSAKRSFIVPSATMTIHPVRLSGLVLGVPQTYRYFQKMQERINGFILKHSRISEDALTKYMMNTSELVLDIGSVLDEGLIDNLGSLSDALSCLYELIENGRKDPSE